MESAVRSKRHHIHGKQKSKSTQKRGHGVFSVEVVRVPTNSRGGDHHIHILPLGVWEGKDDENRDGDAAREKVDSGPCNYIFSN